MPYAATSDTAEFTAWGILARLQHPDIARLIDGGTTPEGFPYFVMEYVEGESYLSYCRSHDLPLERRIAIFQFVCAAVEYAHQRNIVHRDLKPTNILVKADGTPKLLDFGIAKLVNRESGPDPDATLTGFPMMTPAYASPEQLRGEPVTMRSDINALGAVLWEALTGELPRGEASVASYDLAKAAARPEDCAALARVAAVIRTAMRETPAKPLRIGSGVRGRSPQRAARCGSADRRTMVHRDSQPRSGCSRPLLQFPARPHASRTAAPGSRKKCGQLRG